MTQSQDKHLLYLHGMAEPMVVPEDQFRGVWKAILDGDNVRWVDDDETVTRINFGKLPGARLVPSDAHRARMLAWREGRRQDEESREKREREQAGCR